MPEDQITSKQVSSHNVNDKKNISDENTLPASKHEVNLNEGILKQLEGAEVATCNENKNTEKSKNIEAGDVNNRESAITSRELAEKKTVRTRMATNVNNSMER